MVKQNKLHAPEVYFPLKVHVCHQCWLVQVDEIEKAEHIFDADYTYFSSFSKSWLAHAQAYVEKMTARFGLNTQSKVIEIASNDGYLLQYFKQQNIPVLGVEPTANTAKVAQDKGIPCIVDFFGSQLAQEQLRASADLILGNNVLAHVPDINDFIKGVKIALKPTGVVTFEFPHLCQLVAHNQFDTIYHEHFSYLSLTTVKTLFEAQGLNLFDVEELPTHGGSLRIYAKHNDDTTHAICSTVACLLEKEDKLGVTTPAYYKNFQDQVDLIRSSLWSFLIEQKQAGKKVVGYGAAAKGNTLLNYAGVKGAELISYVADASPHKQDRYLPGSRIPVVSPEHLLNDQPDYVIIFPWNLKEEIAAQLTVLRQKGTQLVVFIPKLEIF
jgi:SAM-dependent methyltransferase